MCVGEGEVRGERGGERGKGRGLRVRMCCQFVVRFERGEKRKKREARR